MEADWAVEIGGDAPRIEADWSGFVDLRRNAEFIDQIAEARKHPAIRAALLDLNVPGSSLSTSKCDAWTLAHDEIDPIEFDSAPDETQTGLASYIDAVLHGRAAFASFSAHEAWVKRAAKALSRETAHRGRVDLVVRAATANGADGFGVTLYAAGCGVDSSAAEAAWAEILRAAVVATMREAPGE